MDNQRIIQSTLAIFSFKSWTPDVVITVEIVRAPNADRRSGAPHMYWPHIQYSMVVNSSSVKRRWLYDALINAALIIHCVDCSVAESLILVLNDSATPQSTQWIINAAYNQRSLQSTPLYTARINHFSFCNHNIRGSGLIWQNRWRWLYDALIIHCVAYIVAEPPQRREQSIKIL
jgi:hypothetical protein